MEPYLNKHELKLIKLQSKAQDCISRTKAQKILHKYRKKILKMSEANTTTVQGRNYPAGPRKNNENAIRT